MGPGAENISYDQSAPIASKSALNTTWQYTIPNQYLVQNVGQLAPSDQVQPSATTGHAGSQPRRTAWRTI